MRARIYPVVDDFERQLEALRGSQEAESSGEFTIDPQRAREMAEFQLASPHFYLLKWLQAAVALGAYFFDLRINGDRVEVIFGAPETPGVEPQGLLQSMARVHSQEPGFRRHLCLGLLTSGKHPLELEVAQPENFFAVRFPEGSVEETSKPNWYKRNEETWFRILLKRQADSLQTALERDLIAWRGRLAPLLLVINGSRQHGSYRGWDTAQVPDWHTELSLPFLVLVSYRQGTAFHLQAPDQRAAEKAGPFWLRTAMTTTELRAPPFAYKGPQPEKGMVACNLAFTIDSHLEKRDTPVTFVQDGVCLDPIYVPLGVPGLTLFADGNGLKVDLSEFGVVRDEPALRQRLAEVKMAVTTDLTQLRDYMARMPSYPPVRRRLQNALKGFIDGVDSGKDAGPLGMVILGVMGGFSGLFALRSHDTRDEFQFSVTHRLYEDADWLKDTGWAI